MNNFCANLYEFQGLFDQVFSVNLFQNGAYVKLFFSALLPSFVILCVFYFGIKYPFCRWYHWFLGVVIASVVTGILSFNILTDHLANYMLELVQYPNVDVFVTNIIILNIVYCLIGSVIFSSILKQFNFPQKNIPWGGK